MSVAVYAICMYMMYICVYDIIINIIIAAALTPPPPLTRS